MSYKLTEIPYAQFEKLGMGKKETQDNLNADDIERLLNGEKTNLKTINIKTQNLNVGIDTKFSLSRNKDNSVALILHPKRQQIDKSFNFTEGEVKGLENGDTILKKENAQDSAILYQMDKETKEIMQVKQAKIFIPDSIEDIKLSLEQKDKLRNGDAIELQKEDKKLNARLDLNKPQLLKINISNNITLKQTPKYKR
jgi:Protein of unknown function (DUF4099)/Protein of unknown function (DUF3945)